MNNCIICGNSGKLVNHHICYKENITIKVCYSCHKRIHAGSKYTELKPIDPKECTMVQVKKSTIQSLKQANCAEFGDSYDTIINKLLKLDKKK